MTIDYPGRPCRHNSGHWSDIPGAGLVWTCKWCWRVKHNKQLRAMPDQRRPAATEPTK